MTLEILAVDDSRTMRDMIRLALIPAGFTVHTADDGIHGIEVLNELDQHAIITDINMPRMDGIGFLHHVRQHPRYKSTPVLLLATETRPEVRQAARDEGAQGFINKPCTQAQLLAAVQRLAR